MDQLNEWHVARITQSFLVVQALYGLSMCTAKWSMLFMLKRIFAVRYFKVRLRSLVLPTALPAFC